MLRGPKAARVSAAAHCVVVRHLMHPQIYAETRGLLQAEGADSQHEIYVLRGGFSDFQARYRNDPLLVENWDAEVWN